MPVPIDPSMAIGGAEWQIAPVEGVDSSTAGAGSATGAGGGFGSLLGDALGALTKTQTDAAAGAQSLAAGTAQDPTAVVMAVERAQLSMQLASQIRNKLVESAQDIFHTQI
jgi:flagellar hook-basal body complex protein FliE